MRSLLLLLVSVAVWLQVPVNLHAEIIETAHMRDVLPEIETDALVVFDLDNTIMAPAQTLGSDQWYEYLVHKAIEGGSSKEAAIDAVLKEWTKVQLISQVKPIEADTPALIRALLARGVKVMGLTARPTELAESSSRQLRSIGINLQNDWQRPFQKGNDVVLSDGVIFVGPNRVKGEVFGEYFKSQNIKASRVVFLDDKQRHNNSMQAVATNLGVEFTGHRYNAADAEVKAFNPAVADAQFTVFTKLGLILSDADAKAATQP